MPSMNISIPENLREFVEAQVHDGGYGSASEYVRELIRMARERTRKEAELRALIAAGLKDIEEGRVREYTDETLPELFEEIRATVKKRLGAKRKAK
ncbi:MAG: type II toxin-antitoxin system ParD family antitoxin [Planctomycetes bacterium]|nr:type II toxin-antitoxin system ParD family antitoxin [Planctomycetota bacterium]